MKHFDFGFVRRPWARAGLLAVTSAVVLAGIALAGAGNGYPAQDVKLLSGAAWLASSNVGQVTLLDGTSTEVAAQVPVAPAGNALDVVQQGSTAYAVDRTAGTVRRVDGATFDLTAPTAPIDQARGGLTAFASADTLYTLDTQRGVLANSDPRTLTARGRPLTLSAQLSAGTATLDDAGRLWVIDTNTGDLTWIAGGKRTTHRQFTRPGKSVMTLANGNPVVVNSADRKAITVDPGTGEARSTIDLDLRPDDTIQVSGSPHSQRLYVVASRGVLNICDLGSACDNVVPLDAANRDLGAAVEAGNRLFIPDYTTGQVWIVDLTRPAVIAKPKVLTPAGKFQLLTRDGVVFFNDPNTERAGVIHLDGTVKDIAKYDPRDPTKGIHAAGGPASATSPDRPAAANQAPPNQAPPNGQRLPTDGQNPPNNGQILPTDGQNPTPDGQNLPTDGQNPTADGQNPTADPSAGGPATDNPPTAPTLRITVSKTNPVVNEDVTLRVDTATGTPPASSHWDFGDNQQADGVMTTHHWTTAKTYQVSVQATMPDGQQGTTSVSIQVSAIPKAKLTVNTPTNGRVSGGGIACPSTCSANVDKGQLITLTAQPNASSVFSGWGGACSGTVTSCSLTMDADKTVSATFKDTSAPPSPEDCVSHDPNRLTIVNNGAAGYTLVDSGNHGMATLDTQQDAQNALSVARGYTQHCFDSRNSPKSSVWLTEYWKGGAGRAGPVSNEDCISYNRNNLTIVKISDSEWSLRDGSTYMESYTSESDAVRGRLVAQQYSKQCFIGRNNRRPVHRDYILEYWR